MNKFMLEYVWLDGYKTPNLRSKVKIIDWMPDVNVGTVPKWNFDGSSTNQATGNFSECVLQPVRIYKKSDKRYTVFCEVQTADGSDHPTNTRAALRKLVNQDKVEANEYWFGFEQEYFMTKNYRPLGFPNLGYPPPQGLYYCGNGGGIAEGRDLAEQHMSECLHLGIDITGINAEVAIGQWEYQCFAKDPLKAADDLWITRFELLRCAERAGLGIDLNPKPIQGDWNGSGCHTNFSNISMRNHGGKRLFNSIISKFEQNHKNHIALYGENNEQRLTGLHETQHIDTFTSGVADRGASIRVPYSVYENEWTGYLEDRRPASNCDPYQVAFAVIKTTETANED